jgi:glycyl-tRNA synthetase beta chain
MSSLKFLLELGVEELPTQFLKTFYPLLSSRVEESFLRYSSDRKWKVFLTPRRMGVYCEGIPLHLPPQELLIVGPPWESAFPSGEPSPSAFGFSRKYGKTPADLMKVEQNGKWFCGLKVQKEGISSITYLSEEIPRWFSDLPLPKTMRWNGEGSRFLRPVRWLLAVVEDEDGKGTILPVKVLGVPSGSSTYPPRFLPEKREVVLTDSHPISSYFQWMKRWGVLLFPEDRKSAILRKGKKILSHLHLSVLWDSDLLDEIVYLTEAPLPLLGRFPEHFSTILPSEVIRVVLKDHQRSFPVVDEKGKIAPYFLFVANQKGDKVGEIKKGWERVVSARLNDALFYFREDLGKEKDHFLHLGEKLFQMTFLEGGGTVGDRVERVKRVAKILYENYPPKGVIPNDTDREILLASASLFLNDLATRMVYEYPELHGIMGGIYIRESCKHLPHYEAISILVEEADRSGEDGIPSSPLSSVLSVAQRIDLLLLYAFLNLLPTSTKDPYSVRKTAYELLRILRKYEYPTTLKGLLEEGKKVVLEGIPSFASLEGDPLNALLSFLHERIVNMFLREGFPSPLIRSILSVTDNPFWVEEQLVATYQFQKEREEEWQTLLDTYKRFRNITRNYSYNGIPPSGEGEEERNFLSSLLSLEKDLKERNPHRTLQSLKFVSDSAKIFFEKVRIMDEDPEVRFRRVQMILYARTLFNQFLHWDTLLEGES